MMYIDPDTGAFLNQRPEMNRVLFVDYDDAGAENPRDYGQWVICLTDNRDFPHGDHVADHEEEKHMSRKRGWLCVPVYAYVHSGVAFSLAPFGDPWDSGCCGYAYARLAKWGRRNDEARARRAINCLKTELETYQSYVNGEVYWAGVEDTRTGEILDSCGGYYGADAARDAALEMLAALPPEDRQLTFKEDAACAAAWR